MKKRLLLLSALAALIVCACSTDPLFGKVEGVGAVVTAPNKSTPLYGANVTIADVKPRGYVDSATTDAKGGFAFPNAPDGTYRVTATSGNGKLSTIYLVEVFDGASPEGRIVPVAPARVDTFVEFTGRYDAMGALMRELGYPCSTASAADLALNPNPLDAADIAFLDSGCEAGKAGSAGTIANLRNFVSHGGRLIVSDRAWPFVAAAWPDKIAWETNPETGSGDQRIHASVTDADLKRALTVGRWDLSYDQPSWSLPTSTSGTVFVRGNVRTAAGTRSDAPLLIGFPYGDGYVVYATFGWERQYEGDRLALRVFQYLLANI